VTFARPEGLWLAASAAGVLLAYLVRRRARRVEVPFLPLWVAALAQRRGGFGARVSRWLDLALLMVACACAALAAGAPRLPGSADTRRDLVLVLDGGLELRARGRLEEMRRAAREEIARRAIGTRVVVVSVRDDGERVETRDPLAAIEGHEAGWLRRDPSRAFALAVEAARGLRNPDIVVCSFRPPPPSFRFRAIGHDARNAGFVSIRLLMGAEGERAARLEVAGSGRVEVEGLWSGELEGRRAVDAPLPPAGRASFRVRAEGDEFPDDDEVFLLLEERAPPRLLVVAEGEPSPFLAAALQALEKVGGVRGPLERAPPRALAEAADRYDVLVFDRCAPPSAVEARALYLAPPPGALPFAVGEEAEAPALFLARAGHPLLAGLGLERIPPRRARPIRGGEALATAAPGPCLAVGAGWVALGFDPDRCLLGASPSYPLFLRNAIAHLAEIRRDPPPEFLAIGERAGGETLLGPPGFREIDGRLAAVNLLEPALDLSGPGRPSDPLPSVGEPGAPDRPLDAWFAAAGACALLAAWLVSSRR
jgi:hypothetical protein